MCFLWLGDHFIVFLVRGFWQRTKGEFSVGDYFKVCAPLVADGYMVRFWAGFYRAYVDSCFQVMTQWPNKGAAGNSHRPFSFDGAMKFEHHDCSRAQSPVAVPELDR